MNSEPAKRQGTDKSYLLARVARDAPDILARYEAGEIKSARAAAVAAGIIKITPPSEKAKTAMLKLPAAERIDTLCGIWLELPDVDKEKFFDYVLAWSLMDGRSPHIV